MKFSNRKYFWLHDRHLRSISLNTQNGFTLIELMVAVAVIGILTAIALPSYNEQIAKGRRSAAKSVLLNASQFMERFYTENYRYDQDSATPTPNKVTDASQFPARFSTSPPAGEGSTMYDIDVVVTSGVRDVYLVRAVRRAGSAMGNDKCGNFTIDQLGRRSLVDGTYNSTLFATKVDAIRECWR
jgi:type IV pilus assembly protein PilE